MRNSRQREKRRETREHKIMIMKRGKFTYQELFSLMDVGGEINEVDPQFIEYLEKEEEFLSAQLGIDLPHNGIDTGVSEAEKMARFNFIRMC